MTTAIAERPAALPKDQLELVRRTVANGATNDELALFLYDCERRGIHPLDKLLHFTKRGGKYTPVTSIDFMRAQAAMSGEMAGSEDPVFGFDEGEEPSGKPDRATVTVYRMTQGQRFPYTATARWTEYCPDNGQMWKRMPHTMLGKCAEALALRKAFPQQLAGLYSREEMDQADAPQGYVVEAPAASTPTVATSHRLAVSSPSVPNGGDSGHSNEGPDLGADLPAGAKRIVKVEPNKGGAEARITFHDRSEHLTYKPQLVALAEQLCQDSTPIFPDLKKSASGNFYIVGLVPIPKDYNPATGEMIDAKDIPF